MLLEAGAAVDHCDSGGCSALMKAAEQGYLEVVQLLLAHGADLYLRDQGGSTALDMAVGEEVRELLLQGHATARGVSGDGGASGIDTALSEE